jgi:hypothetical protein
MYDSIALFVALLGNLVFVYVFSSLLVLYKKGNVELLHVSCLSLTDIFIKTDQHTVHALFYLLIYSVLVMDFKVFNSILQNGNIPVEHIFPFIIN